MSVTPRAMAISSVSSTHNFSDLWGWLFLTYNVHSNFLQLVLGGKGAGYMPKNIAVPVPSGALSSFLSPLYVRT